MGKAKPFIITSVIWILVIFIMYDYIKEDNEAKEKTKQWDNIMIPNAGKEPSRGYDYDSKDYFRYTEEQKQKINYTDEEIRQMRRDNPNKIIKHKQRYVPSDKELFEEKMERYIDDHHDEIIERYRD